MREGSAKDRQHWMGLLARAEAETLDLFVDAIGSLPAATEIRAPEIGLVMVRGRMSGSGAPFNFGEMTVTRCTVTVEGVVGHSLIQGRRPDHARVAATLDALLQLGAWRDRVINAVIEPLQHVERQRATDVAAETAKTRVDFFTLVRGEDTA